LYIIADILHLDLTEELKVSSRSVQYKKFTAYLTLAPNKYSIHNISPLNSVINLNS